VELNNRLGQRSIKMYLKIHYTGEQYGHRFVIAVCDEELIGKTLKDRKYEIKVNESFYKGDIMDEEEVIKILKDSTNANLLGEKATAAGLKAGVITKENIIKISGIPHAQAVSF